MSACIDGNLKEKGANVTDILVIEDLHYSYRSDFLLQQKEVLQGISLRIARGECFGFLGHNGAGKTTTIKCILGLCFPTSGKIFIDEEDASKPTARKHIGFLAEQPYYYDHLTVYESMEMFATLTQVPRGARSAAIAQALDTVELSKRSKSPLRTLSKGLTQRLGLAQAIVHTPKLLILDEPFSGLDPIGRRHFRDIFYALKERDVSMFISSHALNDIEYLCDRASILVQGQIKRVVQLQGNAELPDRKYEILVRMSASCVPDRLEGEVHRGIFQEGLWRIIFDSQVSAQCGILKCITVGAQVENLQPMQERLEDIFVEVVEGRGV
jgi:ABC-2 type transport system ATP-binding protein